MDIKSDFLQGKSIERDVIIKPPKEVNTNKLWKLKTQYMDCVMHQGNGA